MNNSQIDGVVQPTEPASPAIEDETVNTNPSRGVLNPAPIDEDIDDGTSDQDIPIDPELSRRAKDSRRKKIHEEKQGEFSVINARMAELEAKTEFINEQWGDSEKKIAIKKHGLDSIDDAEYNKELKELMNSGLSKQKAIEIAVRLQQQKKEQADAEELVRKKGRESASLPMAGSSITVPEGFQKMSKDDYLKFSMDTPEKLAYIKKYNAHWETKKEKPYQ